MELVRFDISSEFRRTLEPLIIDSLFEYAARHRSDPDAPMHMSLSQAMEVLTAQNTRWRERLGKAVSALDLRLEAVSRKCQGHMHEMLRAAHEFFRREGAHTFRAACELRSVDERFAMLWTDYFSRNLLDWLRDRELITDTEHLETADLIVECAKLWTRDVAELAGEHAEPSSFFVDVERETQITIERGPVKLKIRGRPDAIVLRPNGSTVELREYALSDPDTAELRIAQAVFFMQFAESAYGVSCPTGSVSFFLSRQAPPEARDDVVDAAFEQFVGNLATVSRLKQRLAAARRQKPAVPADQWLIAGGPGVGKTELTRCIARALGLPLVELHSASVDSVEDFAEAVDESLDDQDLKPLISMDAADHTIITYPPCVIFFDDAHGLRRRIEWVLPLLSAPRKLHGKRATLSFPGACVIAATSEVSKLPEKFRAWFRQIDLEPYRVEDTAEMVKLSFTQSGLRVGDDLARLVARMGRCNPLRARLFASELRDRHRAQPAMHALSRDTLLRLAGSHWKVDEHGLGDRDYQYLQALESGPKGLPSLQQLLPNLIDELTMHIEPYLIQLGAVHRSSRGRALTVLGEQLLHRHRGARA